MQAMVEGNRFVGYRVGGQEAVSVSHLQFADDTLLLGMKSWANVRALRAVLLLFELMSGLKVNFNKSMLVGVNISDSWLCEAAFALRCRVGGIPFLYLGLPIGGDPRRLGFWEPVLARIRSRLSGWGNRFLSFGGRLVLLKSVLTSLPVYALSFFKAPPGIISTIESLLVHFFWGGCEDSRKTSWINWKTICLRKEYGGLGGAGGPLWHRAGQVEGGGRLGSAWWREIVRIRDGVGGGRDRWFGEGVARKVGDGTDTLFWTDPWVGGTPLCERFRRLFDLAATKSRTVAEMYGAGWEAGGEAWVWRRHLWAWEEELLGECQALLLSVTLQAGSLDRWQWRSDPISGYSVRDAYQVLTSQDTIVIGEAEDLIWHRHVPLKVSIFAWRLLRDRLPTKANLVSRGILAPNLHYCVAGCGSIETAQHLFLSCSTFGSLWALVRSWIGFSAVDAYSLTYHFLQFTYSAGGLRARRSFLQLIWLACLLDKVKLFSYRWLLTTDVTLATNYHYWWSNPLLCLGID
ncbi:hypothetical protein P8452_58208 [Trifolium repens]|nr:hypothetical protein P8452_58208 [Trifolium repens]